MSGSGRGRVLLEARHLSAFYGQVQALCDVSIGMTEGAVTALLGSNGAGKTTLLRALCGMIATRGEVWFDGQRIDGRRTDTIARLGIAHVPEGRGTFCGLSVEENLRAAGLARPDGADQRRDQVFGYFPRLRERRRWFPHRPKPGRRVVRHLRRRTMVRLR